MSEKVDLSLDDIIKMNKKSSQPRGNKPNKPNLQRLKNLGARSGIVRKGPARVIAQRPQLSPKREPTMLHVSNLHYNVSNEDVRELFSELGTIKKAVVHYDKSGRSLGTAEVTFTTRDAAVRAIEKYNQLPLDGRPMKITLVPGQNKTAVRSPTKSRIGVKPGSGIYKKPQSRPNTRGAPTRNPHKVNNTKGRKPNFKQQRGQKKPVTAEQLDADLAAYKMNVDTES